MSHTQLFYVAKPKPNDIRSLIATIGKGHKEKTRADIIKKLIGFNQDLKSTIDSIESIIKNKKQFLLSKADQKVKGKSAYQKEDEYTPPATFDLDEGFLRDLNELKSKIKQAAISSRKPPHETVGQAIELFAEFNRKHNLGYIPVKHEMTNLLTVLTIGNVSMDPRRSNEIINGSIDAFVKASNKQSKFGTHYELHRHSPSTHTFALNRLKGLFDFIREDAPKVPTGISQTMPDEFYTHMKSNLNALMYSANVGAPAFNVVDAITTFGVLPASVSYKTKKKNLPEAMDFFVAIEKLKTIYENEPFDTYKHEVLAMEKLFIYKAPTLPQGFLSSGISGSGIVNMLIKLPEAISLIDKNNNNPLEHLARINDAIYVSKRFNATKKQKATAQNFSYVSKALAARFETDLTSSHEYANINKELALDSIQFNIGEDFYAVTEGGYFEKIPAPIFEHNKKSKLKF